MQKQITSGIPGLDEVFLGGMYAERCCLLYGTSGTGKTILSIQWILEGVRLGEKCLYITLLEPTRSIKADLQDFGWNLDGLDILDLTPQEEDIKTNLGEYTIFPAEEVERINTWEAIYNSLEEIKPTRVVIDAITQLRYAATEAHQFRKCILNLVTYFNIHKITSFLIQEPNELSSDPCVDFIGDVSILLSRFPAPNRMNALRTLSVEKRRGADYLMGPHQFLINNDGITIIPHVVETINNPTPPNEIISSGLPKFDEMLHGGLSLGSTTIISGPSGSGKSTIGMNFLIHSALEKKPAVIFTFEESVNTIIRRSSGISLPIRDLMKKNLLQIVRIHPMEIYPDQFLKMVRSAVQAGCKLVMLDNLIGYIRLMGGMDITDHLINLVSFLNNREVTTFLVDESAALINNLQLSIPQLNNITDNIILTRYGICHAEIIKVVTCLKKRTSDFQPVFRKMAITKKGLVLGEEFIVSQYSIPDTNF